MDSPESQQDEARFELPDMNLIANCHRTLADEMVKLSNIPVLDAGAMLLNEMRALRGEIRDMRGEIRDMRVEIRDGMQRMDTGLKANEVNSVARLSNSTLINPDAELSPLHNVTTNELIENFPATPRAVGNMTVAMLDIVLTALGMGVYGRIEQKKQRLRTHLGLKPSPV